MRLPTPWASLSGLATLSLAIASALSGPEARAWGDLGHQTVAEIADRNLSPRARGLVQRILGVEPLAVAAVWPDIVRSDDRFKAFAPYHFVEIAPGLTFETIPDERRVPKDAHAILTLAPRALVGRSHTRDQKMILLRYLVHVVGDVHQPLHVGNGQDMGGNLCDVQWKDPESGAIELSNLHSVWDEKVFDYVKHEFQQRNAGSIGTRKRWFGYRELADLIVAAQTAAALAVPQGAPQPASWYAEAQSLHPVAYPDAGSEKPETRPYCKLVDPATKKVVNGSYDRAKLPTLDEAYGKRAVPVVLQQVLKGGLRLAGLLNELAAGARVPEAAAGSDARLLESVELRNKLRKAN